ncbi:MAG: metal-sensitive transcriptional regulator [Candidatus Omnitrophica bacterium]|nr:metal-sensitive transcriptional regulator [Candidatus Omnitrophota bacterium]
MKQLTLHHEQLISLKRIEGQIRGIQKMIEDGRYCVDVITQLHSIVGAILSVEDKVFRKHLDGCVVHALKGKSEGEKIKKIDEIMDLIKKFRRSL